MLSTYSVLSACVLMALSGTAYAQDVTADQVAVAHDQSVLIDVLANDAMAGTNLRVQTVTPGRGGTTRLEGGLVRYTPKPGFVGTDRFRYIARSDSASPSVAVVTVEVTPASQSLTLAGQVVDSPIPNATVSTSFGSATYTSAADGNGYYRLTLPANDANQMVTLRADGTSTIGAPVEFASTVGTTGRLVQLAGSDGTLDSTEHAQTSITHITSAQFVLLEEANGGQPIGTQADLQRLSGNVDLYQVTRRAAAIKLVVDGGEPLPAGVDSVLDLAASDAALDAFAASLAPGQFAQAIAQVASTTAAAVAFAPGRIPSEYALLFPSAPGTVRVGMLGHGLLQLDDVGAGNTSGTGAYLSGEFRDNAISWSLSDGRLMITFATPVSVVGYARNACGWQDEQTSVTTSIELVRVSDGDGIDYLEQTAHFTRTTVDGNPNDACDTSGSLALKTTTRVLGYESGTGEVPYTDADLGTDRILHHLGTDTIFGQPVLQWALGGSHGATVAQNQGRLFYTRNGDASGFRYELRRYQTDGRLGHGVLVLASHDDGRRAVKFDLSVARNVDVSNLTPADLYPPARLRSGFDISQFQPELYEDFGFYIRAVTQATDATGASGIGDYESVQYDDNGAELRFVFAPYSWQWRADATTPHDPVRARFTSYADYTGPKNYCALGVNGCFVTRTRDLNVYARDGDRYYVMETLSLLQPNGTYALVSRRGNFYDVDPTP